MNIVSASYNEFGGINVVIEDMPEGSSITVPADPANKDYVALQAWAKEGNEIKAYEAPPPPPPDDTPTLKELAARIDAIVNILHSTRGKQP